MARISIMVTFALSSAIFSETYASGFGPGRQQYGYIDVRDGAHMFYWLYYTTADVENYTQKPLIIWLQGGPGASATGFGNFVKDMNVLFIDSPVGAGFSYIDDDKLLTANNKMIADDLVEFMKQFYVLNPEFKLVPIHIFSESYGGKMAAEFALELNRAISNKDIESNLKSVALGDPWIAPIVSVYAMPPLLLYMGIIDVNGYDNLMQASMDVNMAYTAGNFTLSTSLIEKIWNELSNYVDYYNIMTPISTENKTGPINNRDALLDDLMRGPVSEALNIRSKVVWGSQSAKTFRALSEDFMKPVVHVVEQLLNNTDLEVIVYTGQLDLICATPATVAWVESMVWSMKNEYIASPRTTISINGILEGYVKKGGKLSLYWVNRAGHTIPAENPSVMDYILKQVMKYD